MPTALQIRTHYHKQLFRMLYGRTLVFNTCWEDPAVDRRALDLGPDDTVLVITSAGCNALDYALAGPRRVQAVDANPRQNALLELKLAGIRCLDFDTFFRIFGQGRHPDFARIYADCLQPQLSTMAREFWGRRTHWFTGGGCESFYFRGLSGLFARIFRAYRRSRPKLRDGIARLLEAETLPEQRRIYAERVAPYLWSRSVRWALKRRVTLTLLGVPSAQRDEILSQFDGNLPDFVRSMLDTLFTNVLLRTNYFWSVYIRGHYTRDCCPEYLREENFLALKAGLADRIWVTTDTITGYLRSDHRRFSRYVLLDHMDWMNTEARDQLAEEWAELLAHATSDARVIFRSGAKRPSFIDDLSFDTHDGRHVRLSEVLSFDEARADALDRDDRVGTYASFHVADFVRAPEPVACP